MSQQWNVILTAAVKGVGQPGEALRVAAGFARNYLFPKNLAKPATAATLAKAEREAAERKAQAAQESQDAAELANKLIGARVTLEAKANEDGTLFGGISEQDILAAIADQHKATLPTKTAVDFGKAGHPKSVGEHPVLLQMAGKNAEVIVVVSPAADS